MKFFDLSNPHLFFAIAIAVLNGVLMCFVSTKFLQILQLSGYKFSGYKNWLKDTKANYVSRLAMISFLSISCMLVVNALFDKYSNQQLYSYFGLILYFSFTLIYALVVNKAPKKTPLVQTARMIRLTVATAVLACIFTFALILLSTEYINLLRFGIIGIMPLLMPIIVLLAYWIMHPLEELIKKGYVQKAKKKLSKCTNLIKIGITGSYGKTSTKYILNRMLAKKYKVCMSPNSYNTPMGITKVVLKYLKTDDEILICEMGAKQVGEIKQLCDIVHPTYGIITSIGEQHIETFGNIENIKKTKNELSKYINSKGYVAFNIDNPGSNELFENRKGNKLSASIENVRANCYATDIQCDENGSTFELHIDSKKQKCKTKLIGKHNIQNIVLASVMAFKLGVSIKDIAVAINELDCVPHRLEIKKQGQITILDNSYNSSKNGCVASLEALALFKNRKIVVTPGLIELGKDEYNANFEFGKNIAKVADVVIIVNKIHQDAIYNGLLQSGFEESKIYKANQLNDTDEIFKNILEDGDVVLFENDLPDNYT